MGNLLVTPDVYISGSYVISNTAIGPVNLNREVTRTISGSNINIAAIISKDAGGNDYHEGEVLSPRPGTSTVKIDMGEVIQRHTSIDKVADAFETLVGTVSASGSILQRETVTTASMLDTYHLITAEGGSTYTSGSGYKYQVYPDYVTDRPYDNYTVNKENYWLGTPWTRRDAGPYVPEPSSRLIYWDRTYIPGQYCFWTNIVCYKSNDTPGIPWIVNSSGSTTTPIWPQGIICHYGVNTEDKVSFFTKTSGTDIDPNGAEVWDYNLTRCDNGTDLVFYYINDWGGLDWFNPLVKAKEIKSDNIEKNIYRPRRDTSRVYQQKRTRTWRIKSGMLTDQADLTRCQELLKARRVWMHMPQKNYMVEVIVQDNSVEYKTFQNQGRKWPSYQFTVQEVKEISLR